MGSVDPPFNPLAVALGAEASFVARTHDLDRKHMMETFRAAHDHRGAAFVEIYQNCNVFNDGQFNEITRKQARDEMMIELVHGEPIRFGAERPAGRDDGRRRPAPPRRGGRRGRGRDPASTTPSASTRASPSPSPGSATTTTRRRRSASSVESIAPGVRVGDRQPARRGGRAQGPRRPRHAAPLERHLDRLTRSRCHAGAGTTPCAFSSRRAWARSSLRTSSGSSTSNRIGSPDR